MSRGYEFHGHKKAPMSAKDWAMVSEIFNSLAHSEFLRVWPPSEAYHVFNETRRYAFEKAARLGIGLETL